MRSCSCFKVLLKNSFGTFGFSLSYLYRSSSVDFLDFSLELQLLILELFNLFAAESDYVWRNPP
ncbi:hypothetical protein H5410_025879 [Solanum commersonii]|uniref:Uncharacterized protein n=1 Tax=Solanum commersonii TaxID=4109 RepID=A0A9J5YUF5_SOLCO|nr:hypothetical protein H5410_025879 [Solanum commersonii]